MPWLSPALLGCVLLLTLGGLALFVRTRRIRPPQDEPTAQPFAITELTESLQVLLRAESKRTGLPVEVAVSPVVPQYLVGDARRIQQVLLIYLAHAFKVAGHGKILVTVWCRPGTAGSVEVTFAVSDDGPGTAPAAEQSPSGRGGAQADAPDDFDFSASKKLAEEMGGRAWVEREAGHGATFFLCVNLPRAEALGVTSASQIFSPLDPLMPAAASDAEPDPFANLRLLVRTKRTTLQAELTLFLTELDGEIAELAAGVAATDAQVVRQLAHRLAGRFYFVAANELAELAARVAAAARTGDWDAARRLSAELRARGEALGPELVAACPTRPAG